MTMTSQASTRDRILIAAADLLEAADGADVSTRAICERAGVQAPALYHHFGSKDALLDEVVSHGFRRFLEREPTMQTDPVEAVRAGWDAHVRFGAQFPAFYLHIYGRARKGEPCAVVTDVQAMILRTLTPAAEAGRLSVDPGEAATELLAASSGVILAIITGVTPDSGAALSSRIREAVLAAILGPRADPEGSNHPSAAGVARPEIDLRPTRNPREVPHGDAPLPQLAGALSESIEREGSPLGSAETTLLAK